MRLNQQQILNALGPRYAAALRVVASNDDHERKQLYSALKPTFNDGDLAGIPTPIGIAIRTSAPANSRGCGKNDRGRR